MSTEFYRGRLNAMSEQTEKRRQALADARALCATAFEEMMSANELEPIRAAIQRFKNARIAEEVAKSALIATLEAELHMVKMGMEGQS